MMSTPRDLSKNDAFIYYSAHLLKLHEMIVKTGEKFINQYEESKDDDSYILELSVIEYNNMTRTRLLITHIEEYVFTRGYYMLTKKFRSIDKHRTKCDVFIMKGEQNSDETD